MNGLDEIAERVREDMETRMKARDEALAKARILIRHASRAIRAVHRDEPAEAKTQLKQAGELAKALNQNKERFPDIYFSGYTQDALKEYAEATIVQAMVEGDAYPSPEALQIPFNTYLKGLGEAATEMRRRCLDQIRAGKSGEAVALLEKMEEIYGVLVTMDYPDAITHGLRRQTDIVRSVMERTRGDLTISLRQQQLENSLRELETRLDDA